MHIRLACADDAAPIAAIYASTVKNTHISFKERAPDATELRNRILSYSRTHPWLVAVEGGEIIGYAYAASHRNRAGYRWSVDSSVYLSETARGKGVGRRLYAELFRILAAQGIHNVFAGITNPNEANIALHRRMGFTLVGTYRSVGYKCGSLYDTTWWQRRLIESPALPRPEQPPMRAIDLSQQATNPTTSE